jgi:ABC-2 type transport system ATP-binding protein
MSQPLIELRGVTKVFRSRRGRVKALDNVSFVVNRGDVFGLLGANGAGKTTALRCILGLSPVTGGEVRFEGQARPNRREFFARAAYLPEEPQLFQGATGREHLQYFGRLCGLRGEALRRRVDQTLETVGLAEAAKRQIHTYSKGMKQRLGVAAAILHRPQIVFLDEPTRGLDPIGRREVRDVLRQLAADGATLFLNSHLLSEVERLCNRVGILDRGALRAEGLLADLLTAREDLDVRFSLPGPPDAELAAMATPGDAGQWRAVAADAAALADLAGRIAKAGGKVISAQSGRIELEDYFVRIVKEGETA